MRSASSRRRWPVSGRRSHSTRRSPQAHHNHGLIQQAQGQHGAAEASYRQALALRPTLADAELNLGHLLAIEGRTAEAVAHLERALALAPDSAAAQGSLAKALRDRGPLRPPGAGVRSRAAEERAEAQSVSAKKQLMLPPLNSSTMGRGCGSNSPSSWTSERVAARSGKRARYGSSQAM